MHQKEDFEKESDALFPKSIGGFIGPFNFDWFKKKKKVKLDHIKDSVVVVGAKPVHLFR